MGLLDQVSPALDTMKPYGTSHRLIYLSGPIGFVAMILFRFAWPKDEYLPNLEKRRWVDLDFLGSFLVIAAAVLVTFAFQNAGVHSSGNPWGEAVFIAPLVVGVFGWIGLAVWQRFLARRSPRKMAALPSSLIKNRIFSAAALNTIFLGFAFLATLYTIPLRLQVVNGKSPIMAGVMMLPMVGATGLGSVVMGFFSRKDNRLSETMIVATVLVTLGLALETTVSDSSKLEPKFIGFMVFIGLGYGMSTATATVFTAGESSIAEHGKLSISPHRFGADIDTLFHSSRTRPHCPKPDAGRQHRYCDVVGGARRPRKSTACRNRTRNCACRPAACRLDRSPVHRGPQDIQRRIHRDHEGLRHRGWHWHSHQFGHLFQEASALVGAAEAADPGRDSTSYGHE